MLLLKLRSPLIGFMLVVACGTLGYHLLEGWGWLDSFWMVVITLTTIGYSERFPLSPAGQLFTVGMITIGLGLSFYTVGQITRYMVEGDLAKDIATRRRRRQMNKLENHFIVIGHGRLGREVADELYHRGQKVVAIDVAESSFERQTDHLASYIVGDATHDDILEGAAISRARGLAVCTGSEPTNLFVSLSGRQLNPSLYILTRVEDHQTARKALRAGANSVINPYGISGARMAQGLLHPHAGEVVDRAVGRGGAQFAIEDIRIGAVPAYNGRLTGLEIPQKHKVLVLAVRKPDGEIVNATERSLELNPGDIAVVVGRPEDIAGFADAAAQT